MAKGYHERMFGGIAPLGSDQLVFATFDGHVLTFDTDAWKLRRHQALYPAAPRQVRIVSCDADPEGNPRVAPPGADLSEDSANLAGADLEVVGPVQYDPGDTELSKCCLNCEPTEKREEPPVLPAARGAEQRGHPEAGVRRAPPLMAASPASASLGPGDVRGSVRRSRLACIQDTVIGGGEALKDRDGGIEFVGHAVGRESLYYRQGRDLVC